MLRLLYFADPMCSWCYGFAPVMRRLVQQYASELQLELVMGGLRAGETRSLHAAQRREILEHWHHVEEASGQPFDYARGLPEGFVYDTEPACRAVVAARILAPARALAYLDAVQHAFYAQALDVTRGDILCDLAVSLNLDRPKFAAAFAAEETVRATRQDFEQARDAGVLGFPCLMAAHGERRQIITMGYRPYASIVELLRHKALLSTPA